MDRNFGRCIRERKIEINLVRVLHAHIEHHEKDEEQGDGFENGFKHGERLECLAPTTYYAPPLPAIGIRAAADHPEPNNRWFKGITLLLGTLPSCSAPVATSFSGFHYGRLS